MRVCQQCGEEFLCVVGRPIFCSVTCQARHADEQPARCGAPNGDVVCVLPEGHTGYHECPIDHPKLKRVRWGIPEDASRVQQCEAFNGNRCCRRPVGHEGAHWEAGYFWGIAGLKPEFVSYLPNTNIDDVVHTLKTVDDDPGTAGALAGVRDPRPRKVSEVVDELAGLWGLDSDDAAGVICALADKIRAQHPLAGWTPTMHPSEDDEPEPSPVACKRCGERLAYPSALFCGAACAAMWESGDTPSAGPGSPSKPLDPE